MGDTAKKVSSGYSKAVTFGAYDVNNSKKGWAKGENPVKAVTSGASYGLSDKIMDGLGPKAPKQLEANDIYNVSRDELGGRSFNDILAARYMGEQKTPAQVQMEAAQADAVAKSNAIAQASAPQIGAGLANLTAQRNQGTMQRQANSQMAQMSLIQQQQDLANLMGTYKDDRDTKLGVAKSNQQTQLAANQANQAFMGSLLKTGGTLVGAMYGGPAGAAVGSQAGQMVSDSANSGYGGGTNSDGSMYA